MHVLANAYYTTHRVQDGWMTRSVVQPLVISNRFFLSCMRCKSGAKKVWYFSQSAGWLDDKELTQRVHSLPLCLAAWESWFIPSPTCVREFVKSNLRLEKKVNLSVQVTIKSKLCVEYQNQPKASRVHWHWKSTKTVCSLQSMQNLFSVQLMDDNEIWWQRMSNIESKQEKRH